MNWGDTICRGRRLRRRRRRNSNSKSRVRGGVGCIIFHSLGALQREPVQLSEKVYRVYIKLSYNSVGLSCTMMIKLTKF